MVSTISQTKKTLETYLDHQSAASVISIDDLLSEILLRLPAASIIRFKSVCKHWQLLLSHTLVTHRYDKLLKSPGLLVDGDTYVPFDVETRSSPPYRSLELHFKGRHVEILQSCNGLLLCVGDYKKYYVFNPTTKQLVIIPPLPGGSKVNNSVCFMGLAFHQTDCVHYKVVCIRELKKDKDLFQIQIYSSDTKKWKISIEFFFAYYSSFHNPVFWNGAVNLVTTYKSYMYFKIDDEQLQTFPMPEGFMASQVYLVYFGESRGHLHLILLNTRCGQNILRLNVYELLRDHSGWFVKYQLDLDELSTAFPEIVSKFRHGGYDFEVVDVVRGEAEEDTFVVLNIQKKIIRYNVHDKSFKQIFTLPSNKKRYQDMDGFCYPCFHRYTETLTSLK